MNNEVSVVIKNVPRGGGWGGAWRLLSKIKKTSKGFGLFEVFDWRSMVGIEQIRGHCLSAALGNIIGLMGGPQFCFNEIPLPGPFR